MAESKGPPAPRPQGEPVGSNPQYVAWLRGRSMLGSATEIARRYSGVGSMWQHPYADPDPRAAARTASVWFSAYPLSLMTATGSSYLATLGDEGLWEAFEQIGIDAVHTGPVKQAGGLSGWDETPSVDGNFDRISTGIDPSLGTVEEFRGLCATAARHGGTVIDDIVPGHTGKGADFRLAELGVGDYPGIFHMVEIPPTDWHLLPEVPAGEDAANLDEDAEDALERAGHIVGRLQRVIFAAPGVKETNWSATGEVLGADGVVRRWVYLHYFKAGQPSINWIDPTFAGMRLVVGDALHSMGELGAGGLRLDANGFLGVEKGPAGSPAWSEGHPLSEAANQIIASVVRKLGGFSFQELNLAIDDIATMARRGADLSYDFVNRPAYHHSLATGDTEFLRLTLRTSLVLGVQPVGLVHALQNHDELTYELVHFETAHGDDPFEFRGAAVSGAELAALVRADLVEHLTGDAAPYNAVFTTNGISSTTATMAAASLGIRDLADVTADHIERIMQAHLLLAMFNAWQPGVFCLSGWDLCGMTTLDPSDVADLLADGDTRWIHRAAYDLMDVAARPQEATSTMPRGRSLYGSLPAQLADAESFVSRLARLLEVRRLSGITTATQVDVPDVPHPSLLAMVHEREGGGELLVTALNFGPQPAAGPVTSAWFDPGSAVVDKVTGRQVGRVDDAGAVHVDLGGHDGTILAIGTGR